MAAGFGRRGRVTDNAACPLGPELQLPACTAPAGLTASAMLDPFSRCGARRLPIDLRCASLSIPTTGDLPPPKQSSLSNSIQRFQPIKCADSSHVTVAGRCSGGALISMVFAACLEGVWSAGGLTLSFLHYLTASGGCWDTGGLGPRLDSVLQLLAEYLQFFLPPPAASSSVRPAGLPCLAPPRLARASGLLAGPLLSRAPTQAYGSMKQEKKAERERSRPPRLRLGQEKR